MTYQVCIDIGSTFTDCLVVAPDSMIHDDAPGFPKVDLRSVGAGGGGSG